jgi:hypothetical protein
MATTSGIGSLEGDGLTADDVTALRIADGISLHYYDAACYIHGYLVSASQSLRIYSPREQRIFHDRTNRGAGERARSIRCGVSVSGYQGDSLSMGTLRDAPHAACFASIVAPRHRVEWQTITGLLKPGDQLILSWVADNNNATIREADLHVDEVALRIPRTKRVLVFRLVTAITPDNTARMIRRYG